MEVQLLSPHINKLPLQIIAVAKSIFFVNIFSISRNLFITILSGFISEEAIMSVSLCVPIITVINMLILGILSTIGIDIEEELNDHVYSIKAAKYFYICLILVCIFSGIIFIFSVLLMDFCNLNLLTFKFMILYIFALIPFIFSSALRWRGVKNWMFCRH